MRSIIDRRVMVSIDSPSGGRATSRENRADRTPSWGVIVTDREIRRHESYLVRKLAKPALLVLGALPQPF
jgi:hypothetical protein